MTDPAPAPLRRLGSTDLKIAPLVLGGNVFGWTADHDASFAVLDAYVAGGGVTRLQATGFASRAAAQAACAKAGTTCVVVAP